VNVRRTLLARLAAAAGACALLVGAAPALAQDYHHHDHGGGGGRPSPQMRQPSGRWNGSGGARGYPPRTVPWNGRGGDSRSLGPWNGHGGPPSGGRVARGERPPSGWDTRRYNGYWSGGRWFFGPPQAPGRDVRPGFVPWRRGAYLPPQYLSYALEDYWRFHLRRPPYGYEWVQVGSEFLLISIGTGLIFDVVEGG
jgi:Ni/Co efflux regulator RcnB